MPSSSGNGRSQNNNSHDGTAGLGLGYVHPDFDRQEQLEITFNRRKHVAALELCRVSHEDVMRIIRDGPTLPQDVELVRAMAVLSLWEVREQHFLHRMYLAQG